MIGRYPPRVAPPVKNTASAMAAQLKFEHLGLVDLIANTD